MNLLLRVLITSILVLVLSYVIKGVVVDEISTAITVAIVLGLLNFFVKPILLFFTFPLTVLSFGLFYFVINALIILLCDHFVDGFEVKGFWTALFFSIIDLSI